MNIQTSTISASLVDRRSAAQAGWIVSLAALTAIGAQIEIPHSPVPFTLQTFAVLLAGGLLGKRNGAVSQGLYLLLGIAGLPVFSGLGSGLARLLGPTGGYLLSFPVAAFVVGYLLPARPGFGRTLLAMAVGLLVIFSLGTLQLYFLYFHDVRASLVDGLLIFSWWDAAKVAAAAGIVSRLRRAS